MCPAHPTLVPQVLALPLELRLTASPLQALVVRMLELRLISPLQRAPHRLPPRSSTPVVSILTG